MPKEMTCNSQELERLKKLTFHERKARRNGFQVIAGVDEAGRGPLAGPVVAAACILPKIPLIPGINDSKKVPPEKREELFQRLTTDPRVTFAIGIVEVETIDRINILQATIQAMMNAVNGLALLPDLLLIDAVRLPHPLIPVTPLIKGDTLSYSIAAASILAKVTRDRLMHKYHVEWPEYGFDEHKGYGTEKHYNAIEKFGPCPIHRLSFEPFKSTQKAVLS